MKIIAITVMLLLLTAGFIKAMWHEWYVKK